MTNKDFNPDIGKETQFGVGQDPSDIGSRSKIAKWSIRGWERYFSAHNVDAAAVLKQGQYCGEGLSIAQKIALKHLAIAETGDMRAIELATDNIEGKLPQTTINAELEAVKRMTDDELRSTIAAGISILAKTGNGSEGSQSPGSATGSEAAQEA